MELLPTVIRSDHQRERERDFKYNAMLIGFFIIWNGALVIELRKIRQPIKIHKNQLLGSEVDLLTTSFLLPLLASEDYSHESCFAGISLSYL